MPATAQQASQESEPSDQESSAFEETDDSAAHPDACTRAVRTLTQNLINFSTENDIEDGLTFCRRPISIKELFDFSNKHWVRAHQRSAVGSLNDELEFYELLDLDAPGDPDLDLDVEASMDAILSM